MMFVMASWDALNLLSDHFVVFAQLRVSSSTSCMDTRTAGHGRDTES